MASDAAACTVTDLLPRDFESMEAVVDEQIAADPELSRNQLPRMVHRIIAKRATNAILAALNKSILLILPAAWSRAPELTEYSDETKHPSGEETTLFLGEHKFEIDYKPIVNVRILTFQRPLLKFRLILSTQVRSASITIRNGHIVSVGECDCAVEAELKHIIDEIDPPKETGFHLKLKSRELKLVDAYELKSPVPIGPRARSASPAHTL
ncbi:MAG: hypothetical protein ABI646_08005 [Acidobacteriota bacterium]